MLTFYSKCAIFEVSDLNVVFINEIFFEGNEMGYYPANMYPCKTCKGRGWVLNGGNLYAEGPHPVYGECACPNPECQDGTVYVALEVVAKWEASLEWGDLVFINKNHPFHPFEGGSAHCPDCVGGVVYTTDGKWSGFCKNPRCNCGLVKVSQETIERLYKESKMIEVTNLPQATFKLGEVSDSILQRAKEIAIQHREARRAICCTG